jgi:aspartate kinase
VREGPLVIKFGGTSVGEGARFVRAAGIAADAGRPTVVVVSAMSGTTDALLDLAKTTAAGNTGDAVGAPARTSIRAAGEGTVAELHRFLAERHMRAARAAVSGGHLPTVEERLRSLLGRLLEVVDEPFEGGAARRDAIVQFGERLSAEVMAGAMRSLGVAAEVVGGARSRRTRTSARRRCSSGRRGSVPPSTWPPSSPPAPSPWCPATSGGRRTGR